MDKRLNGQRSPDAPALTKRSNLQTKQARIANPPVFGFCSMFQAPDVERLLAKHTSTARGGTGAFEALAFAL
jgi:hypothetical protein